MLAVKNIADFTDMLWLPVMHGATFRTYMWVFVDECQDLSPLRLEIAMRSVSKSGRMVFVGDDCQAIYGFAGADTESFDNVIKRAQGKVLPLPICYRCPTSHIALANAIVPDIVAREGAEEGSVRHVPEGDLAHDVEDKTALVLCRVNAPLFRHAYALIAKGRKVAIAGRDLGAGLKAVIRHVFGKRHSDTFTHSEFMSKLTTYKSAQMVKLSEKYEEKAFEAQCERLTDKVDCLAAVCEANPEANTCKKLRAAIDDVFNCKNPDILFSSVHRAKGLEHTNVYILNPEKLGVGRRELDAEGNLHWQDDQEKNLQYVAYTRSMSDLVFLAKTEKKKTDKKDKVAQVA